MSKDLHVAFTFFPQIGLLFGLPVAPGYPSNACSEMAAIMSLGWFVCPHAPSPTS